LGRLETYPTGGGFAILFFLGRRRLMGARRIRREQRREDMKESRHRNGILKTKERARRDARMMDAVKAGKLPYPRAVMNWLSTKLDKPSRLITAADLETLAKEMK